MRKHFFLPFAAALLLIISSSARSMPFRVNQIPNGSKYACANCHVDPQGGGARNAFGRDIERKFLDRNGNVIWGKELASLDSDGDGFTNGSELHDPDGSWKRGKSDPGDLSTVFNPGEKSSRPAAGIQDYYTDYLSGVRLTAAFPNPASAGVYINYSIDNTAAVPAGIYSIDGRLIRELNNDVMPAGQYSLYWDGTSSSGESVPAGAYLFKLTCNGITQTQMISIVR